MNKLSVYGLTLFLFGLLAACGSRAAEPPAFQVQESAEAVTQQPTAETSVDGATAITAPEAPSSPVPALEAFPTNTLVVIEAAETQAGVVCETHGAELAASDPAAVQLASGGLQLVEFFAFW